LKQIGIGLQMYADNHGGFLPCNPYHVGEQERQKSSTVEIWRGSDSTAIGLGLLAVEGKYLSPQLLFCPSDKYHEDWEEAFHFGEPGVTLRSSYIYRCCCEGMGPKLEQDGLNSAGKEAVALVMDFNCLDIGEGKQAENHKGKTICILCKDLHVEKVINAYGMAPYWQNPGLEWVYAPFPLILEKDDPANYPALWMAADVAAAEAGAEREARAGTERGATYLVVALVGLFLALAGFWAIRRAARAQAHR